MKGMVIHMLTSKQRAYLRGIAQSYETILQVGKGGISENLITQVNDALRKRELIKLRVLDNSCSRHGRQPRSLQRPLRQMSCR